MTATPTTSPKKQILGSGLFSALLSLALIPTAVAAPPTLDWSKTMPFNTGFEQLLHDTYSTPSANIVDYGPDGEFAVRARCDGRGGTAGYLSQFRTFIYDASGTELLDTGWHADNTGRFFSIIHWDKNNLIVHRPALNGEVERYEKQNGSYTKTDGFTVPFDSGTKTYISFVWPNKLIVSDYGSLDSVTGEPATHAKVSSYTMDITASQNPLGLIVEVPKNDSASMIWASEIGVTYRVQQSTDMSTWTSLPEIISGTGQPIKRTYATTNEKMFFRLGYNN